MCPCGSLYAPLAAFQLPRDRLGVCGRLGPREALLAFRTERVGSALVRLRLLR